MVPYQVHLPIGKRVPILISVPHCGTNFPSELSSEYDEKLSSYPDDTDWFVDRLYDFAPALGMTMISAVFSRWVVDLNRDPEGKPLYSDGRIITGLCPVTDFLGNNLYKDGRISIEEHEMRRRVEAYYLPYHRRVEQLLSEMKNQFGEVLLWDCHSIRQQVPTIQAAKFPDLILGSADETSASKKLIDSALESLRSSGLAVSHNHPFKGGFITRKYGTPEQGIHALQLEMTKVNYMDDTETVYDIQRAEKIRAVLKGTLTNLARMISPK